MQFARGNFQSCALKPSAILYCDYSTEMQTPLKCRLCVWLNWIAVNNTQIFPLKHCVQVAQQLICWGPLWANSACWKRTASLYSANLKYWDWNRSMPSRICLSRHCLQFLVTVKTSQLVESQSQSNANTKGASKFSVFAHKFIFTFSLCHYPWLFHFLFTNIRWY